MIDVCAQVLRDGKPLTRPTRWSGGIASFDGTPTDGADVQIITWKLFQGAASMGEQVQVSIVHLGEGDGWIYVRAMLVVDGIMWPESRPGHLFVDRFADWGDWSCVLNFEHLSDRDRLNGVHSLLLKTIVVPKIGAS